MPSLDLRERFKRQKLVFSVVIVLLIVFMGILFVGDMDKKRVVKVTDGDSFVLRDGLRVRLLGIDAPELDRCMGLEAQKTLSDDILNHLVRLKNTETDSYGRILANVIRESWIDWVPYITEWGRKITTGEPINQKNMVNLLMVSEGLARYTSAPSPYSQKMKTAQADARNKKLGIWSETCTQTESPTSGCVIKANVRDGEKVYHLPDCSNYDQTIISTSYGDVWLCTEEEATELGFRKASGCKEP